MRPEVIAQIINHKEVKMTHQNHHCSSCSGLVMSLRRVMAGDEFSGVVNINTAGEGSSNCCHASVRLWLRGSSSFATSNGDFANIDEIVAVKGIGEASLDNLQPYLTTKGATTWTPR